MNNKKRKIKVAFPHMGTVYVIWGSMVNALGAEAIIPPYTSKKTLSLGVKYSPEAICLPYKLVLGNYIEAIEKGADVIGMISSPGICRLGEYSTSIKRALEDMGYKTEFLHFDFYKGKLVGMIKCLMKVTQNKNIFKIVGALHIALRKIFVLDNLEELLSYYRARELDFGTAEKAFKKGIKKIFDANSLRALKEAEKEARAEIEKTPIDKDREILKVDLTGEIFMVLDEFSNQNLEIELGKLGVQVRRSLTLGGWIKTAILPKFMRKGEPTHLDRAHELAKPYLMRDIGGDAIESVSDVVYAYQKGSDGIIHLSPFTCMPEIMSQNIFPTVREDFNIPLLALVMDEQTGRAGFVTRLEAFVDLMRRRKRQLQTTIN